ncbi:U-box domain-containing protein 25-like [Nymphaea colorata]|uniref:U-box domain-containing protein 25-like n=1 Tax=Nymphaea colorata TaxID=210225 RepID=UPI00129D25FB|nr:U-box domain-containing protein 25-like [Nymphaea colorata]
MPGSVAPLETVVVPVHFRCPISLELMRDPVTVCSGQTYDRTSIEPWLASADNPTCPVTRLPLADTTLIPNHTLRRLIQEWCVAHRSDGVDRIPTPKQPADPSLVSSLVQSLQPPSSDAVVSSSLRRLKTLALDSDKNRALISQNPNLRSSLVSLLFTSSSDPSADAISDTLALISFFPLSVADSEAISARPDRLTAVSALLRHSSPDVRVGAASLVENLAVSPESRSALGDTPGIIAGVVAVLRPPTSSHPRAARAGAKALLALCLARPNRDAAAAEGAAGALVDLLASAGADRRDAERALATLELLCRTRGGCEALLGHALAVPLLVKAVLRVSERATESAAGALLALCRASEARQRDAVGAGAVTQLLLLVQSDCTERAKRKAQLLLKLLLSAWPDHPAPNSDLGFSDLLAI